MKVTVLVPTHDHGPTLLRSVRSALAQTVTDLEVFIVGDGVPAHARGAIQQLLSEDARVRFFDYPKGPRHGEIHRHTALVEASGQIVCYLSDDDLWLPTHLETMAALLDGADFAHALPLRIEPDGTAATWTVDVGLPEYRLLFDLGMNTIPLSCGGHSLAFYRRLPEGWRTTPPDRPTDLYMWQQFLAQPECRAVSGTRPSVLNFPSSMRRDCTLEERLAELDRWADRLEDAVWRERFLGDVLDIIVRDRARQAADLLRARSQRFGPVQSTWTPVFGDWCGTGVPEPGLRDHDQGAFFLQGSSDEEPVIAFYFGPAGEGFIPIAGDWDGDGVASVGLYDPASSVFYLKNSNVSGYADASFTFGPSGRRCVPLSGDWDGRGFDSVGLYDPETGTFYLKSSLGQARRNGDE